MKHHYQKWAFRERKVTGYSRNGPLVCKFYRVGIKDGPTALKKNVIVTQTEEFSLPSQNAPTTL